MFRCDVYLPYIYSESMGVLKVYNVPLYGLIADDGGFVSAEVLGDGSGFDESGFMGLSLPTEVKLVQ